MADPLRRDETVGRLNKESGTLFLGDLDQVRRVAAVVPAHDEHQVRPMSQEFERCVLPLLRGAADRVVVPEPLSQL